MVQSTNLSWWTRTRSRHCLQTWPPQDTSDGPINSIGTGGVAFNISLLEIGRSYWIRNVLKIKESLNGEPRNISVSFSTYGRRSIRQRFTSIHTVISYVCMVMTCVYACMYFELLSFIHVLCAYTG